MSASMMPTRQCSLHLPTRGIHVTIGVPNNELLGVGQSNATALTCRRNVAAMYHYQHHRIAVGLEVPTILPNAALFLFLHSNSSKSAFLHQILMTKLKFPHLTAFHHP
ncbi:hypothetical protein IFM89_019580 [Coptis chinensis]|uniref:Uncharacterized protein n=1 Tax=Coptis chinensis TaxID=261450 RepID=A0A835M006_9MAGN|nr:hypothetical protein IFM89_019580 [Coptis chinensis]